MAQDKKKEHDFAWKVRDYFGFVQPGQKKLTPAEMERQAKSGSIPKKAEELGKNKKKKSK